MKSTWFSHFHFQIDRWLPGDWPEIEEGSLQKAVEHLVLTGNSWPKIYNSLNSDEARKRFETSLLRAASCLFWHVFYWPDRFTEVQMETLKTIWQYHHEGEESPDWIRAYINIHLYGAHALHLYSIEGFSESVRGSISHITQLASSLKAQDSLIEPGLLYANDPLYFNETIPMQKSLFSVCALSFCLDFHINRNDDEPKKAFNAAFEAFSIAEMGNIIHLFFKEPTAIIEEDNMILALVAAWIESQNIADVFDEIYSAIDLKVDWRELADRCDQMWYFYDNAQKKALEKKLHIIQFVSSKFSKVQSESGSYWTPSYPLNEFWAFARGLCITRLSPDSYRKLRDDDERHAALDRLRKYFFDDVWHEMPSDAQEALITADRVFWATEGRKGDVLENLRLAIEPILEQQLLVPFRSWCSQHSRKTRDNSQNNDKKTFLRLSTLFNELWADHKLFNDFAQAMFPNISPQFWKDLRSNLYSLRDARGATTHPEKRGPATADQISDHYHRVIGIGQHGTISQLLHLHPKQTKHFSH